MEQSPQSGRSRRNRSNDALLAAGVSIPVSYLLLMGLHALYWIVPVGEWIAVTALLPAAVAFVFGLRATASGIRHRSAATALKGLFVMFITYWIGIYSFCIAAMMAHGD